MKKTNKGHQGDKLSSFFKAYEFISDSVSKREALPDFPTDQLTKIHKSFTDMILAVRKLYKENWVSDKDSIEKLIDEARQKILWEIEKKFFFSSRADELRSLGYWKDKARDIRSSKKYGVEYKVVRCRGIKTDDAFNILLYLVVNHLKRDKKKKFSWSKVPLILAEHKIPLPSTKADNMDSALKKQYERTQKTDIRKLYEDYRSHSVVILPRNPKSKGITIGHALPSWEELTS